MHSLYLATLLNLNIWNSVRALQNHPDVKYEDGIGYIDDLRKNYLPTESFGCLSYPYSIPIIATMPGFKENCPGAYEFFVKREISLIQSDRFIFTVLNYTACAVSTLFLATLMPHMLLTLATGLAGYMLYNIVQEIMLRHYDSKADEYAVSHSTKEQKAEALGFIRMLQQKAKENTHIRPFVSLGEAIGIHCKEPKEISPDVLEEHDKWASSLNLGYKMRPSKDTMPETEESLFREREAFHVKLEESQLLSIALKVGLISLTVGLMPSLFATPFIYVLPAAYFGSYNLVHWVGDHYFRYTKDSGNRLGEVIHQSEGVYTGAYWRWGRGVSSSPSHA